MDPAPLASSEREMRSDTPPAAAVSQCIAEEAAHALIYPETPVPDSSAVENTCLSSCELPQSGDGQRRIDKPHQADGSGRSATSSDNVNLNEGAAPTDDLIKSGMIAPHITVLSGGGTPPVCLHGTLPAPASTELQDNTDIIFIARYHASVAAVRRLIPENYSARIDVLVSAPPFIYHFQQRPPGLEHVRYGATLVLESPESVSSGAGDKHALCTHTIILKDNAEHIHVTPERVLVSYKRSVEVLTHDARLVRSYTGASRFSAGRFLVEDRAPFVVRSDGSTAFAPKIPPGADILHFGANGELFLSVLGNDGAGTGLSGAAGEPHLVVHTLKRSVAFDGANDRLLTTLSSGFTVHESLELHAGTPAIVGPSLVAEMPLRQVPGSATCYAVACPDSVWILYKDLRVRRAITTDPLCGAVPGRWVLHNYLKEISVSEMLGLLGAYYPECLVQPRQAEVLLLGALHLPKTVLEALNATVPEFSQAGADLNVLSLTNTGSEGAPGSFAAIPPFLHAALCSAQLLAVSLDRPCILWEVLCYAYRFTDDSGRKVLDPLFVRLRCPGSGRTYTHLSAKALFYILAFFIEATDVFVATCVRDNQLCYIREALEFYKTIGQADKFISEARRHGLLLEAVPGTKCMVEIERREMDAQALMQRSKRVCDIEQGLFGVDGV